LLKKGAESLAGRTGEETVLPFTFREYAAYNDPEGKIAGISASSDNGLSAPLDAAPYLSYRSKIRILFDAYLKRGGFPHLFGVTKEVIFRKLLTEDVIGKVIYRDLVEQFGMMKSPPMS
jgi:predicted AAA+ superfamily ATPase